MKSSATVVIVLAGLTFAACTSTTEGTGAGGSSSASSTSGGGGSDDPTCLNRCRAKATGCGVPATTADNRCGAYCPATGASLSCLEATECPTIASTLGYRNLCPAGATSSTSTSSSSGSDVGAPCIDFSDCTGVPSCSCPEGERAGSWECVADSCLVDCSLACE